MLGAFYTVNFFDKLHTLTHKMNSVKYFRCKMLSYGSQLEENDLKHPDALLCMEKTVAYCLDIMMFLVQQWCYL